MKKIPAAAIVFAATLCGAYASDDSVPLTPMKQWVEQTASQIRDQQVAINGVKQLQVGACSQHMAIERQAACNAAYAMVVARREAVIAEYRLRLEAVTLDATSQHIILYDITSPAEMDRERKSINDAWLVVWHMFPAPQKK